MLHGAILQVVSGLALVGLNEANDADLHHAKIGVKLVVAVVILVLAVVGLRKERRTPGSTAVLAHAVGLLGVVNVVVAVVW